MAPKIDPVPTTEQLPARCDVVVIGGGIVGLSAALELAERGLAVAVLEKGRVAAEQSSRNLGWVRKTSRAPADLPMARLADTLWEGMAERVGTDVGYRRRGIMFVAGKDSEMQTYAGWHERARELVPESRLLSGAEIEGLVPGTTGDWRGGVYTDSDGYAEPNVATPAIARAAQAKGAVIAQNCAVRGLVQSGGHVSGVETEAGEIACDRVLLAGGLWSRRFLGNLGIALPVLPLICYAFRTTPFDGPGEIAVGGPDFSFRRHASGGYVVTHRAALGAPFVLDHALIGTRYIDTLRHTWRMIRPILGRPLLDDLRLPRRWSNGQVSPFERARIMDPPARQDINLQALTNLRKAWPVFSEAQIAESWAGTMDITPDSNPVIDQAPGIPGLTIATGFSGHGFGTGPAAGRVAAELVLEETPSVTLDPYRLARFG